MHFKQLQFIPVAEVDAASAALANEMFDGLKPAPGFHYGEPTGRTGKRHFDRQKPT
jgi:hypothetical protein